MATYKFLLCRTHYIIYFPKVLYDYMDNPKIYFHASLSYIQYVFRKIYIYNTMFYLLVCAV